VGEGWGSFPSLLVGEGQGGGDTTSWLHCLDTSYLSPPSRGERRFWPVALKQAGQAGPQGSAAFNETLIYRESIALLGGLQEFFQEKTEQEVYAPRPEELLLRLHDFDDHA